MSFLKSKKYFCAAKSINKNN